LCIVKKNNIVDAVSYKTKYANSETSDKKWLVVDADGQSLGRLASKVAFVIRGKHKTSYTPHTDCGDNVIVINADKVALSGNKLEDKDYIRHTGYPGGQRILSVKEMFDKHPERVVEKAVKGMLPKNKLGNQLYRNLRVIIGTEHNMEAQKPETLDLNTIKE
jgi:large subunit ribosomal protein L13